MWSLTYPPHHGGDRRHGQNRVEQPPCASAAWRRTSVEAPPDRGRARVAGRRRTELSFRGKGLRGAYGRDDVASFFPATSPLAMSSPAPAAPAQLAHVESNDPTSTSRGPRLAAHALAVDRTGRSPHRSRTLPLPRIDSRRSPETSTGTSVQRFRGRR